MPVLDREVARTVAFSGAQYLSNSIDEEGRFAYWRRSVPVLTNQAQYNSLRHFGAVWSMFDVARQCGGDASVIEAAGRALDYGLTSFLRPFASSDVLCIVDGPKIKLGGAALAIIAISAARRGTEADLTVAASLGNFILSQIQSDGTFVHSRAYPLGFQLPFISNYYTGQALLALFVLTEMTGDEKWAHAALGVLQRLATSPTSRMESSHWMLYAIERAASHGASQQVRRLGARILSILLQAAAAFEKKSNITMLACTSEGLSAWLRIPSHPADPGVDLDLVERQIRLCLSKILKARNKDGSFNGATGRYDVRIDYVQHAIAAFSAYASQAPRSS